MNYRSDPPLPRLIPDILKRLTEPKFWLLQGTILVITAVHIGLEAGLLFPNLEGQLQEAHHLPVVLYIAPVAYAGLSYGWEGGVFTGLWVGALASINIVTWHLTDFEWIIELTFVLVVVALGVLLSVPVERERLQRRRAEAAASRLETINQVVLATTIPANTPADAVEPVLRRLVSRLDLKDAGVVLWRRGHRERVVGATASGEIDLLSWDGSTPDSEGRPSIAVPSLWAQVTIDTEHMMGYLVAAPDQNEIGDEENNLLVTIGHELAVRAENALLVQQEQEMLTTYVRLVTKAQEEERRRIARDLHDGTAQQLAILVRDLKRHALTAEDPAAPLHRNASEILEEVRRVARDQRPTLLDDLGLVAALEWLVDQARERSTAGVELTVFGSKRRLPVEVEVALYRIAQEALRNADRHADAELIEIAITFDEKDVEVSIRDDGAGFETPRSASDHVRAGRLGLMGMQERSQLIGGVLEIRSAPDKGTTVTVRVPITEHEDG